MKPSLIFFDFHCKLYLPVRLDIIELLHNHNSCRTKLERSHFTGIRYNAGIYPEKRLRITHLPEEIYPMILCSKSFIVTLRF